MRSAVCTATSNFAGSMRAMCRIVQLKQLIAPIGIRNSVLDNATPHSVRMRAALPFLSQIIAENNGFRDFLHGLPTLPAFPLQRQIGVFFVELQIALQDSLRALHNLSGFQT